MKSSIAAKLSALDFSCGRTLNRVTLHTHKNIGMHKGSLRLCRAYNYAPKAVTISRPAVGAVATASVGDEMVSQGVLYEREALLLHKDADIGLFSAYTLHPGYYLKQGENKKSDFYQPSPTPDHATGQGCRSAIEALLVEIDRAQTRQLA